MPEYRPDATDIKILSILQENSKKTMKELASMLKLSTTPVFERIKRLEKLGYIDRYVAILDAQKLGKKLHTFIHISIKEHSKDGLDDFISRVTAFNSVLECHHISGIYDFVLKAIFEDMDQYNEFILNELSVVPNIEKVETRFSLSVRKYTTALPLSSSYHQ